MDKTNQKLEEIKDFLQLKEGWNLDELIEEIIVDTKLLKHGDMRNGTLSIDECWIKWDEDTICGLDDFIKSYTDIFLEKICNVLDSQKEKESEPDWNEVDLSDPDDRYYMHGDELGLNE